MGKFDGKVVLITGASKPTGIGYATAMKFAREGADVVVTDLCEQLEGFPGYVRTGSNEELVALAEKVAELGVRSLAAPLDVTKPEMIAAAAARVDREFGKLDVLVNNAGGSPGPNAVKDLAEEAWQKTLDINLNGTFRVTKAMVPLLAKAGPGAAIVNVASRAAKQPQAFMSSYCTAKAGVMMLTKVCALELAGEGIRVNCVCPGQVETELGAWGWKLKAFSRGETLEQYREVMAKDIPLGRPAMPDEIANLIAFLASSEASFITGQAVNVTGGQLIVL